MVWWISILLCSVVALLGIVFYVLALEQVEAQVGKRALGIAKTVAQMKEIREAFAAEEPWRVIQPQAERIRRETGAVFIVVGNREQIRYSHPNPQMIGKKMLGGDSDRALRKGEAYVSKAVGSMGASIRGKAPIRDDTGRIIGLVSVGILLSDVERMTSDYLSQFVWLALLALGVGIVGAKRLAARLKRSILGLEPEEISQMYQERHALIESVLEGFVMINQKKEISLMNQAALHILEKERDGSWLGQPIDRVFPDLRLGHVLHTGVAELDRELVVEGKELVLNRFPIHDKGNVVGAVASFRLKSELDQLNQQLSQVKQVVEAMRAQTHEFHNTLYTLSGLIQLGSYQEALDLIGEKSCANQSHIERTLHQIPDPWLGAVLLGFYHRAAEMKINLTIDEESELTDPLPAVIPRSSLISILGNLISNALEAVEAQPPERRHVRLFFTDMGDSLLFEVEDAGHGIAEEELALIFQQGYSTKPVSHPGERGYGLATVEQLTAECGGYVTVEKGEWGGAVFTVVLPKERGRS
ncbi:ATP-binding protein [Laceyella putida]|uniref:histidine kinase n=1 Tax=Laceyella putida TaxID=110101 RepID=A0ABW2RNZ8_9BACL